MSSIAAGTTTTTALVSTADTTGSLVFQTGASATTAITINTSQNVGVGTSSPGAKVAIVGTSGTPQLQAGTAGNAIFTNAYDNNPIYMTATAVNSTALVMGSASNIPYLFVTNNIERGRFDTSGNFQFNSGYGSVATAYGCRAWVNFNGTGTVAIRASGNVSSITDNGVGDYTVNLTTAMPDANYSISANSDTTNTSGPQGIVINYSTVSNNKVTPTTSTFRLACMILGTGAGFDNPYINASVFR